MAAVRGVRPSIGARISRPSPAMTVTLIALVFSMAGNGMAAKQLIT
jgi:hypothetical protein